MGVFLRSILLLLIIQCWVNGAVLADTLTLEQATSIATLHNPQLKVAKAKLGISEAEIQTARARLNPKVLSDNGFAEDTYRAGIEQVIELGGKRHKRVALAKAQQAVVQSEIDAALLALRISVRRAYTQLYLGQERQKAYEELLNNTQKLLSITQKREQAGDVSQLDVLQADIAMINAKNDLQTLTNQQLQAKHQLNSLLNQPLDTPLTLAPPNSFPTLSPSTLSTGQTMPNSDGSILKGEIQHTSFSLDSLIESALNTRPEMKQNQKGQEAAKQELLLTQANRIPNLSLTAGPDIVVPKGGDNRFNAFVIANMELPVWDRQQGPIQKVQAEQVVLEQGQAALKNQIVLEVTNAYHTFFAHQNRVMWYETELLPKANTVVEKSHRSFEEGKSSILIPLNAQQAYSNVRLGYLQALVDLQNTISDLEAAIGSGL